jgi:hypothetical protein
VGEGSGRLQFFTNRLITDNVPFSSLKITMENILTDDPRLDKYIIEVVFEYDYDEALTPKTFIPHSLLCTLILAAHPDFPNFFTILDLSLTLKRLILAGVWYDPKNPHMIMWPREYQHALERDISDVGDLHHILLPHLTDNPILEGQPTGVMPENAKFVINPFMPKAIFFGRFSCNLQECLFLA